MAFGKTLEFPVLLGVGERRNALRDFEFKRAKADAPDSSSEAPAARAAPVWGRPARAWALGAARWGGGGGARVPQRSEAGSPGVPGDWEALENPSGAGKARETRYF